MAEAIDRSVDLDRQLESANLPFIVAAFQAWRSIRLRRISGTLLAARRIGKAREAKGVVDSEALRTFVGALGAPADMQEFIELAIRKDLEDDELTPPPYPLQAWATDPSNATMVLPRGPWKRVEHSQDIGPEPAESGSMS